MRNTQQWPICYSPSKRHVKRKEHTSSSSVTIVAALVSCRAPAQLIEYAQLWSRTEADPNVRGREHSGRENNEKGQTQQESPSGEDADSYQTAQSETPRGGARGVGESTRLRAPQYSQAGAKTGVGPHDDSADYSRHGFPQLSRVPAVPS